MFFKTKWLVYIVGVFLLVTMAAVLGFWFYNRQIVQLPVLGTYKQLPVDSQMHQAYSMDKGFYDVFFPNSQMKESISEPVFSAVLPHHLIAGQFIGSFFNSLASQKFDTVIIIGPNHKQIGSDAIITSRLDWQTPYGIVDTNKKLIDTIIDDHFASASPAIIGEEHSISALVPFVKKTWPKATVVPLIIKNSTANNRLDELVEFLAKSKGKVLFLASVDFSHYLPKSAADFHDELSLNVLESANLENLNNLEVDSQPSLYALLKYNQNKQSQFFSLFSHTNSGRIIGNDLPETTSHVIGYYTEGVPSKKSGATLQFFGDIMLDRHVVLNMNKDGLNYVFANLRGQEDRFFTGVNMYIANLEGPFAPVRVQTSKSIAFRFDPALAIQLKSYGFDAFNLANNHSYDMGKQNVAFTREVLQKNELGYFGDEYHQGSEYTYFAGQEQGLPFTVAFIGLNATEGEMDMKKVKQAVADAKGKSKFVIVNIHWGEEYKRNSNTKQQNIAHQLVDWGVDVIIGHHPHVIQEAEVYKGKFIFYSLGNFIFDQYFSKETQEGISVGLILEDSGEIKAQVMPFFSKKSQVQLMVGEQKNGFFDWFKKNSRLGDKKIEI